MVELEGLLESAVSVRSLADFPGMPEVVEDAPTFEGNALKKARAVVAATGLPALADDSGLCVDALGGAPGVLSARYAPGSDEDRWRKLLAAMEDVPPPERGAHFECALVLALPDGRTFTEVGRCFGEIGTRPRGENGFGYDPIFWLPAEGKTMAELTRVEKAERSHRGVALRALLPALRGVLLELSHIGSE